MNLTDYPKILFPKNLDEKTTKEEILTRGSMPHVLVELENGNRYTVAFADSIRFAQDVKTELAIEPYFAETALILMVDLQIERIRETLRDLQLKGFFDGLVPIKRKSIFFDELSGDTLG